MADMNPYIYAIGGGVGGALGFIGKWFIGFLTDVFKRSEERGDRLETKLFETQAVIYPALEAANSAIREAIATKKEG
jgi:hypothetical protein